jgi:tRNA-dihydrouridine synthase A
MVTSLALIHGDRSRFLTYNQEEHPVALQLGGNQAKQMAQAAEWGAEAGFDEININIGCPSDRVQAGGFGAYLMREPTRVADCVRAMKAVTETPITVKCRLGVDDDDSYAFFRDFVAEVAEAGCELFVVHARKALLKGLSPRQNREIPELQYDKVYRIKQEFPSLEIILNGGVKSIPEMQQHLSQVDGVMIGREAYKHPQFLLDIDQVLFDQPGPDRNLTDVVRLYCRYMEGNLEQGVPLNAMAKHLLSLFQGVPGAKLWRRHLSEHIHQVGANVAVIEQALTLLQEDTADID